MMASAKDDGKFGAVTVGVQLISETNFLLRNVNVGDSIPDSSSPMRIPGTGNVSGIGDLVCVECSVTVTTYVYKGGELAALLPGRATPVSANAVMVVSPPGSFTTRIVAIPSLQTLGEFESHSMPVAVLRIAICGKPMMLVVEDKLTPKATMKPDPVRSHLMFRVFEVAPDDTWNQVTDNDTHEYIILGHLVAVSARPFGTTTRGAEIICIIHSDAADELAESLAESSDSESAESSSRSSSESSYLTARFGLVEVPGRSWHIRMIKSVKSNEENEKEAYVYIRARLAYGELTQPTSYNNWLGFVESAESAESAGSILLCNYTTGEFTRIPRKNVCTRMYVTIFTNLFIYFVAWNRQRPAARGD